MSTTVLAALAAQLAHDPGRPLVTFYDAATGERVELSVRTFDNWVSKVANLVSDELMLGPGDTISVDLPTHWQSAVVVVGAWAAGLHLVEPDRGADLCVLGPDGSTETPEGSAIVAVSLRPMGGPFVERLPAGWLDFAREIPPQPDALLVDVAVVGESPAADGREGMMTHADLVAAGRDAAETVGMTSGGRLITDANPGRPAGLASALIAPIVVGGSVVLVVNATREQRESIAEQEGVTAQLWVPERP